MRIHRLVSGPIDTCSDAQIAEWDREDALSADERRRILARLQTV